MTSKKSTKVATVLLPTSTLKNGRPPSKLGDSGCVKRSIFLGGDCRSLQRRWSSNHHPMKSCRRFFFQKSPPSPRETLHHWSFLFPHWSQTTKKKVFKKTDKKMVPPLFRRRKVDWFSLTPEKRFLASFISTSSFVVCFVAAWPNSIQVEKWMLINYPILIQDTQCMV